MRYYDLTLTPTGGGKARTWTSYPGGKPDPGALNIMFDMVISTYATPVGLQTITIEGIALQDLTQGTNFGYQDDKPAYIATLKAGFGGGLPLESPQQKGIIAKGEVFQAFGNWIGTDMTLDLVLNPSSYTYGPPAHLGDFSLSTWTKGTQLSDALKQTLSTAYPSLPLEMHIDKSYVAKQDTLHGCTTLEGLADLVNNETSGTQYTKGPVNIAIQNGKLLVYDQSYKPDPIQIAFNDLIGQPTWISPQTMQMKVAMRADIMMGSRIKMPKGYANAPGFVTTTAASYPSSLKYKPTFTQSFVVQKIRQIGNFRSSDAGEWATVINCVEDSP